MKINKHTSVKVSLKIKSTYGIKEPLYWDVRAQTVGYFWLITDGRLLQRLSSQTANS